MHNNEKLLAKALLPVKDADSAKAVQDAAFALDEEFVDTLLGDDLNSLLDNLEKAQCVLYDRVTP